MSNPADAGIRDQLHQAAERGQLGELVKLLVLGVADQAADIHAKNEAGEMPIHCAVRSGRIETIIYLLCHGADVNAKVESTTERPAGETPLHIACSVGNTQIARHLLVSGADANAKTNFNSARLGGDTPLHLACASGFLEVAKLLLNNGADPNAANGSGLTPLHMAATNGHLKIAEELVCRGANPEQTSGLTPETVTVSLSQLDGGTPPTPPQQPPLPASSGEAKARTEGETMNFMKRLFGGDSKPTPIAPVTPQPSSLATKATHPSAPPSAKSLELPPEFDGKMSYRDMFQTLPPEQLRAMCRALPVEQLDLNRAGHPGFAVEMGRAITQVFAVSIYMATKEVPSEFGDIVFPRLINKIEEYDGSDLHLELCDLVRDFAINLSAGGRVREAFRVLRVLKESLFWRVWPQADICMFIVLQKIAIQTNSRQDYMVALAAAERIPAGQRDQMVREAIKNLEQKMDATAAVGIKKSDNSASANEWFKTGWKNCSPASKSDFHPLYIPRYSLRELVDQAFSDPLSPACAEVKIKNLAEIEDAFFERLLTDEHRLERSEAIQLFYRYVGVVCPKCLSGYNGEQLVGFNMPKRMADLGASAIVTTGGEWRLRLNQGLCPNCDSTSFYALWRGTHKGL
jgi:ankyrin repeat protein